LAVESPSFECWQCLISTVIVMQSTFLCSWRILCVPGAFVF